ncbi:hypothetical protein ACFVDU_22235 [Streptomyces albidoflavus]
MSVLQVLLNETIDLTKAPGCLYGGTLLVVALTSVLARCPKRRSDARATLSILLWRRRSG